MAREVIEHNPSSSYIEVEKKLKTLYSRYYRVQIVQGLIISTIIFTLILLALMAINGLFETRTGFREFSFYLLNATTGLLLIYLVFWPLIKALKTRSFERLLVAESIIREKFPDINDTLFNLLELGHENLGKGEKSLILASIEERAQRISLFQFNLAVPLKKILRPLVLVFSILIVYLALGLSWPDFIKSAYSKTVHYSKEVTEKQMIEILLGNDSLRVGLGNDFTVRAIVNNNQDSSYLSLRIGASLFQMDKVGEAYVYVIESVNGDIDFSFELADVHTDEFRLEVIPLPELASLDLTVVPPLYTGLDVINQHGSGDLVIAEGSSVEWKLSYLNSDEVHFIFYDDSVAINDDENRLTYKRTIAESGDYWINLKSDEISTDNSSGYFIEVVRDQFPGIEATQMSDSADANQVFFQSNIEDDYGFSQMKFIVKEMLSGDTLFSDNVKINNNVPFQRAYYGMDFNSLDLKGLEIEYFFAVWDNDEVNGYKKTESRVFRKTIYTAEEIFEQTRDKGEELGEAIKDGKDAIEKLREELGELMTNQIIDDKEEWEIKSKVDEISDMRDYLEEMIDNIKNENRSINSSDDNEALKEILVKQIQIEELFDKLMDEELQKLFDEFEKLAEEMSKKERIEKTEELQLNLENLEEQLDINLELLKKLEMDKEVIDIAQQMEELGEELENAEQEKDIQEAEEEFDQLSERYEEQLKKNEELKKPQKMDDFEKERDDVEKEIEEAKEEKAKSGEQKSGEQKSGEKKSGEKKKEAGKKMKELGAKMKDQVSSGGSGQNMIDIELIRQLAGELNDFSFKQEELLTEIAGHSARTKRFHEVGIEQRQMELKFNVIRDSLKSLGYSEPMIAGMLNEEVFHVETSLRNLNKSVQEGQVSQVRYEQQKVMEGANELAVRLDELIDNLESMSGEGEGESKFTDSNPKEGAKKVGDMKQRQQSLKEQMKQMIEDMKGKDGKDGKGGQKMVKMLSEREQLRRALEKLRNSGQIGENARKKIREVENMMEEVEKDIIYNRVSDVTIQKEEWIQTRLLEAEQAEKEREEEKIRISQEFKGTLNPEDLPSWKEFENLEKEQGRTMNYSDIKLKEFYQNKYKDYLKRLNKKKNGSKVP